MVFIHSEGTEYLCFKVDCKFVRVAIEMHLCLKVSINMKSEQAYPKSGGVKSEDTSNN